MRCQKCGKALDPRSRFCTNCDYDNYPEMNRVKTKNNVVTPQGATYRQAAPASNTNYVKPSAKKPQQKKTNASVIFFVIVVIYLLLAVFGGLFE